MPIGRSGAGVLLALCVAAAGCGGKDAPGPRERERAAAEAIAVRLGAAVGAADARGACRALTLATRRVIAEVGGPGATCPKALLPFLEDYGLRQVLPTAKAFDATVTGQRATVAAEGLERPLPAVRNAGGWRVTLTGLPGVKADVSGARACRRYVGRADRLGLPPTDRAALVARLRSEARLVLGFAGRLRTLSLAGPPRPTLGTLVLRLEGQADALRVIARRVAKGGSIVRGMLGSGLATADGRMSLYAQADDARVACPADVTDGPEASRRSRILERACRRLDRSTSGLDRTPETPEEALAALEAIGAAFARLDRSLASAPVGRGLRPIRRQARASARAVAAGVRALPNAPTDAALEARAAQLEAEATRLDVAYLRMGTRCEAARATPGRTSEA